jgi:hypothetical protein
MHNYQLYCIYQGASWIQVYPWLFSPPKINQAECIQLTQKSGEGKTNAKVCANTKVCANMYRLFCMYNQLIHLVGAIESALQDILLWNESQQSPFKHKATLHTLQPL